jgi:hypothetical protein
MLQFDKNGYLIPNEPHQTTLDEFQQVFVDSFPESETRKRLFDNYLDWIFDFQRDISPNFTQWINGSFVTQKLNPKDIDFVTFLEWGDFENKEKTGEMDRFWSFSNEDKGLDAYLLAAYEAGHPDFLEFVRFKSVWVKRYSNGSKNDNLHTIKKGFIQIIFQK